MNLCILSMQRVENIGSLLQSYSLNRILEQQGHTVSLSGGILTMRMCNIWC